MILKYQAGGNLRIRKGFRVTVLEVKGNQVKIGIHGPNPSPFIEKRYMCLLKGNEK
ncbi:carbon storage regulator [Microbulbifer epialgicus]|uniref:Carbon storage regulator n=1 Tax=Microbulbifer epialgicus TaxID=393907 RepID=A0ABV4P6K1_9GAMM